MKILYCDIQLGASGDMLVGALLDAGLPLDVLTNKLASLPIQGYAIAPEKVARYGTSGTQAGIKAHHDTTHRNLDAIIKIINSSSCSDPVKHNAIAVFDTLAEAESKVHGISKQEVHFHEVGAIDSIIDILSFCIGIEYFGIDELYYSTFAFGVGTISSAHGTLPLPAPATVALTQGKSVVYTGLQGELTTPTAAAIVTTLGKQQTHFSGTVIATGIGFGTRDLGFPSYTRVTILEEQQLPAYELLWVVECTIDDMNPELYPYVADLLLGAGANDVYYYTVIMKKGRPGTIVSVLCSPDKVDSVKTIIFSETTTLGVRAYPVNRFSLQREFATITLYGEKVRIKQSHRFTELSPKPEYEDCKKVALKTGKPLQTIIEEALKEYCKKH